MLVLQQQFQVVCQVFIVSFVLLLVLGMGEMFMLGILDFYMVWFYGVIECDFVQYEKFIVCIKEILVQVVSEYL